MKREYITPSMTVVRVQSTSMICESINNVQGNANLKFGKGSSTTGRSRSFTDWDDDEY